MNLKKRLILSTAALSFASVALISIADEHRGSECKDQANVEQCRQAQMAKHRAMFESKLHDELKITKEQEPAWKTFIDSFHQQSTINKERRDKLSRAEFGKMSAPERLEKRLEMMKKHEASMQANLASLKTFYAVLTPEQQKIMDKKVAKLMHHKHHRHHKRGDFQKKSHDEQSPEKVGQTPTTSN